MGNLLTQDVEQVVPGTLLYKIKDSCLRNQQQAGNNNHESKANNEDTFVFDESYEGDTNENYEYRILWAMVLYWGATHVLSFAGLVLAFTSAKWQTNLYAVALFYIFLLGIPAGKFIGIKCCLLRLEIDSFI